MIRTEIALANLKRVVDYLEGKARASLTRCVQNVRSQPVADEQEKRVKQQIEKILDETREPRVDVIVQMESDRPQLKKLGQAAGVAPLTAEDVADAPRASAPTVPENDQG